MQILCGDLRGDAVELEKIGVRYTLAPLSPTYRLLQQSIAASIAQFKGKGGWERRVIYIIYVLMTSLTKQFCAVM